MGNLVPVKKEIYLHYCYDGPFLYVVKAFLCLPDSESQQLWLDTAWSGVFYMVKGHVLSIDILSQVFLRENKLDRSVTGMDLTIYSSAGLLYLWATLYHTPAGQVGLK